MPDNRDPSGPLGGGASGSLGGAASGRDSLDAGLDSFDPGLDPFATALESGPCGQSGATARVAALLSNPGTWAEPPDLPGGIAALIALADASPPADFSTPPPASATATSAAVPSSASPSSASPSSASPSSASPSSASPSSGAPSSASPSDAAPSAAAPASIAADAAAAPALPDGEAATEDGPAASPAPATYHSTNAATTGFAARPAEGRPADNRPDGRPARGPSAGGTRPGAGGARRRQRRWVTAVAAVLVLVAGGIGVVLANQERPSATIELAGAGQAHGRIQIIERDAGWRLVLDAQGLPPAPAGSYYQGWAIKDGEYVPLGTFHMHKEGRVELWSGVPLRMFRRIEITTQRVGEGQNPGPPVLAGTL